MTTDPRTLIAEEAIKGVSEWVTFTAADGDLSIGLGDDNEVAAARVHAVLSALNAYDAEHPDERVAALIAHAKAEAVEAFRAEVLRRLESATNYGYDDEETHGINIGLNQAADIVEQVGRT